MIVRGWLIAPLVLAVLWLTGVHAAQARALRTWKQHGWVLGAYAKDATGQFSHCAASVRYRSGIMLVFSVSRNLTWRMGFANEKWALKTGARYPIAYRVDSILSERATAVAINSRQVAVELPAKSAIFGAFRKGRLLKVDAAGQNLGFKLDNTSAILSTILTCAQAGSGYRAPPQATSSNPFVQSPAASASPAATDGHLRGEATAIVANVLSLSGIANYRIAPEVPRKLSALKAVWTAPGLVGGLRIETGRTVADTSALLIVKDAQACSGTFASGKLPGAGRAVRVRTACSLQGNPGNEAEYTILPRPKGGVYVFILVPAKGADRSELSSSGNRILDAAARAIR